MTGGLWPAELSADAPETATLAAHLRADLQRITRSANDELRSIQRAGMPDFARRAEEAKVIDEARTRAVRRVESTMRHLNEVRAATPARRADLDKTQIIPAITDVETPVEAPVEVAAASESDYQRLHRLLAFVVHQEPRLNWAIGDRADGTTVLVTDFAHGWIPPGIALPEGVRLLEPEPRAGKASFLAGETSGTVTYAPGDSLGRLDDFAETKASPQPRELPAVQDLGWELSQATHWRDGLPRMVHTLARAAAGGTGVAEEEIDLLRVHLDTARYQLLIQYPNVDPALFLNCLLLAATEGAVTGDPVSANYHLAWFQKLDTRTQAL